MGINVDWAPHQWSIDLFLAAIGMAAISLAGMFLILLCLLVWEQLRRW